MGRPDLGAMAIESDRGPGAFELERMEDCLVRWIDLLRFPLASLGQQKLRTCLTTMGVVFGAFVLAASLSINEGVQVTIQREASKGDASRKVTVFQGSRAAETKAADDVQVAGRMSPDRRERIHYLFDLKTHVRHDDLPKGFRGSRIYRRAHTITTVRRTCKKPVRAVCTSNATVGAQRGCLSWLRTSRRTSVA